MSETISLFLCGDVMTGRGIDQILPHPSDPRLYERYVKDARRYVQLAEEAHGDIDQPVAYTYIWGDALRALERFKPEVRMVNLETAVTRSDQRWKGKGIHYRMHPENLPCLTEAGVDLCSLANNHVLDWGYEGLQETREVLTRAGIGVVGAGETEGEAQKPAFLEVGEGVRLVVFGFGVPSSGIPYGWGASSQKPGLNLLPDLAPDSTEECVSLIRRHTDPADLVLVSIHWGGNWGYWIPTSQRRFAHRLIDEAGVDLVHGHSSHHVKGSEVYRGKLILYGCGDFINDYEGISGKEHFRGDLALMYFPQLDPQSGRLLHLEMVPLQRRNLQLRYAEDEDSRWLLETLNREESDLGTRFELKENRDLVWVHPG